MAVELSVPSILSAMSTACKHHHNHRVCVRDLGPKFFEDALNNLPGSSRDSAPDLMAVSALLHLIQDCKDNGERWDAFCAAICEWVLDHNDTVSELCPQMCEWCQQCKKCHKAVILRLNTHWCYSATPKSLKNTYFRKVCFSCFAKQGRT